MTDDQHLRQTVDLRKVEPSFYHIRLRFRELWQAWRRGIDLPAARVDALIPFTIASGRGGWYAGQFTVPEGVTSLDIECRGGGGGSVDNPAHRAADGTLHGGYRDMCEPCRDEVEEG